MALQRDHPAEHPHAICSTHPCDRWTSTTSRTALTVSRRSGGRESRAASPVSASPRQLHGEGLEPTVGLGQRELPHDLALVLDHDIPDRHHLTGEDLDGGPYLAAAQLADVQLGHGRRLGDYHVERLVRRGIERGVVGG
ncbi:MAG: hypothetical protein ABWY23_08880 [Mycetocola sp.]